MTLIRVIGVALTLVASGVLGLYLSGLGKFRLQDLLEFKKALLILKSEIEYVATPLPEAMANISVRTTKPISLIFEHYSQSLKNNSEGETAYQLWIASIKIHKQKSFLKDDDWEIIENFGKTLGYLDKQMQVDTITFTTDYIDAQVSKLQEINEKNQRMYRSLGVVGGILLLVIFW
ncbi:MAG: stage III sporulation protein AB [Defluviitaleaceae bacterium]|nr:stage III sporulation protein AB [Defluviitaleaceae bacterium]